MHNGQNLIGKKNNPLPLFLKFTKQYARKHHNISSCMSRNKIINPYHLFKMQLSQQKSYFEQEDNNNNS